MKSLLNFSGVVCFLQCFDNFVLYTVFSNFFRQRPKQKSIFHYLYKKERNVKHDDVKGLLTSRKAS